MKAERRRFIESLVDIRKAKILELGALDNPTYVRAECDIRYLDYASRDELARKGERNPRYAYDKLVDVDYVCPGPTYADIIDKRFDLIIANHVIEHIPDIIRWFNQLYAITAPEGHLFLSIPDKRYTFDIARPLTTFVDILRCYDERVTKPTYYHILEHLYFHKAINAKEAWDNDMGDKLAKQRFTPKEAVAHARKHADAPYADVHCHVFTRDSFAEMMSVLLELEYVQYQLQELSDTKYLSNEFHALLAKNNSA
jgi:SAM-dependent methyltransferase